MAKQYKIFTILGIFIVFIFALIYYFNNDFNQISKNEIKNVLSQEISKQNIQAKKMFGKLYKEGSNASLQKLETYSCKQIQENQLCEIKAQIKTFRGIEQHDFSMTLDVHNKVLAFSQQ
jgi:hypothetical protein